MKVEVWYLAKTYSGLKRIRKFAIKSEEIENWKFFKKKFFFAIWVLLEENSLEINERLERADHELEEEEEEDMDDESHDLDEDALPIMEEDGSYIEC